jgi:hypothetical protein
LRAAFFGGLFTIGLGDEEEVRFDLQDAKDFLKPLDAQSFLSVFKSA